MLATNPWTRYHTNPMENIITNNWTWPHVSQQRLDRQRVLWTAERIFINLQIVVEIADFSRPNVGKCTHCCMPWCPCRATKEATIFECWATGGREATIFSRPLKSHAVVSSALFCGVHMGVSKNGCKPQIIHFNRVFHYKPSILGYPYFWKHPYLGRFFP